MKELSIEDKAKAYDEAIERAKSKIKNNKDHVLYEDDFIEIFPELKESEDERIRKELLAWLKSRDGQTLPMDRYNAAIAWLEKQGEQIDLANKEYWRGYREGKKEILDKYAELENQGVKGTIGNEREIPYLEQKPADKVEPKFKVGDRIYLKPKHRMPNDDTPIADTIHEIIAIDDRHYRFDGSFIFIEDQDKFELVEQKPAWSEDDEYVIERLLCLLDNEQDNYPQLSCDFQEIEEFKEWLKTLKDRVQSKQEWSEEDCNQIETIACHLDNIGNGAMAESLLNIMDKYKSLRLQNTWKPSDEQMAVLNEVINYAANSELQHWSSFIYTLLKSLREQLKKLREE